MTSATFHLTSELAGGSGPVGVTLRGGGGGGEECEDEGDSCRGSSERVGWFVCGCGHDAPERNSV